MGSVGDLIIQLTPLMLVQGIVTAALWPVLKRTSKRPGLWVLVLLVPFVGIIPPWFIVCNGVARALDRVDP